MTHLTTSDIKWEIFIFVPNFMFALLIVVLSLSMMIWLSVYGYFFILWVIARRKRPLDLERPPLPDIAVVIPTLNEERTILSKLKNLKSSDYPSELMTTLIVDGGSTDTTIDLIAHEIERGEALQLLQFEGSQGKPDQIGHALTRVNQDIIVVTDADSILDPSCIPELVRQLLLNPEIAVVGATIIPESNLLEERIHWKLLNDIWWLEGEVLSAASLSGVCYACRRTMVLPPGKDVRAEDIHLALTASSRGNPVRICRTALATETRVPQTTADLIQYRRRRGGGYVAELLQIKPQKITPSGFRIARFMRLWHFRAVPILTIGIALVSFVLLFSSYRLWLIPAFIALAAPVLIILFASDIASSKKQRLLRISFASARLLFFTAYAMLTLYLNPQKQGPVGGRS